MRTPNHFDKVEFLGFALSDACGNTAEKREYPESVFAPHKRRVMGMIALLMESDTPPATRDSLYVSVGVRTSNLEESQVRETAIIDLIVGGVLEISDDERASLIYNPPETQHYEDCLDIPGSPVC